MRRSCFSECFFEIVRDCRARADDNAREIRSVRLGERAEDIPAKRFSRRFKRTANRIQKSKCNGAVYSTDHPQKQQEKAYRKKTQVFEIDRKRYEHCEENGYVCDKNAGHRKCERAPNTEEKGGRPPKKNIP